MWTGRRGYGCWATVVMLACASGCESQGDTTPPIPDEPVVELVGPETVSTELPEFAAALTPDGDTLYFNRTPSDRSRLDLMFAVRVDGAWSEAALFPPTLGMSAIDPFVADNGRRLYFSSDSPVDGTRPGSFNIWFVDRSGTGWTPPEALPRPISSDSSDVFNSLSEDGTLVFSSTRGGGRRIYSTRLVGGAWEAPLLLSFGGVSTGGNPMISPDGSFIVMSRPGASGPSDLFVACRSDAGWGPAEPLPPPINSEFGELAPGIWRDHLFFTSERPGMVGPQPDSVRPPGDLYRTELRHVTALCGPREP